MVKLNHTTIVDNKPVTPFLIDGTNVYCFDKYKETIILPINSFKTRKAKKAPIIPMPNLSKIIIPEPVLITAPKPKPEPPVEEIIIIKAKLIHAKTTAGSIRTIGSADYKYKIITERVEEDIKQNIYRYKPIGSIKIYGMADTKYTIIKPFIKKYEGIGIVQAIGLAKSKVIANEIIDTIPPVVDNSRYIRPTLDDDYI